MVCVGEFYVQLRRVGILSTYLMAPDLLLITVRSWMGLQRGCRRGPESSPCVRSHWVSLLLFLPLIDSDGMTLLEDPIAFDNALQYGFFQFLPLQPSSSAQALLE